jgi:hypothetical protein
VMSFFIEAEACRQICLMQAGFHHRFSSVPCPAAVSFRPVSSVP